MAVVAASFIISLLVLLGSKTKATEGASTLLITPDVRNITLFQSADFRKVCIVIESGEGMEVTYLWERDGQFIDSRSGGANLQLHVPDVDLVHIGHYTCTANITRGQEVVMTLGPTSAGYLNVLDRSLISAPSPQYILEGTPSSLRCSYPGSHVTWLTQGQDTFSGSFPSATYEDGGVYMCDIYVPSGQTSVQVQVTVFVVVPVEIVSTSLPVFQNLTSNRPLTMSVAFRGRGSHDLAVVWSLNGQPLLEDSRITTTFDAATASGNTELVMPQAMREDAGLYIVLITSDAGDVHSSEQEVTFQVDVTVPPALPTHLQVNQISATSGHISWLLQPNTTDQGADSLVLRVERAGLPSRELTLPGDQTEVVLEELIPAADYSISLTAINVDGRVSTPPATFTTGEGAPLIQEIALDRLNKTRFQVSVTLAYTGGGHMTSLSVTYQQQSDPMEMEGVVLSVEGEGLMWRYVVVLSEDVITYEEIEFTVSARNQFGYQSLNVSTIVSALITEVNPLPPTASTLAELFPVWLIVVIASIITILIMIVILGTCVAIHYCCYHNNRKSFTVSSHPPLPDLSHHDNHSSPDKCIHDEENPYKVRSPTSSEPSEISLDIPHTKHKRVPSDTSSIATSVVKATITPSTTASNSPSNLVKSQYLGEEKPLQLGSIMEMDSSSPHSDDSATESEVDRVRLQNQLNKNMSPYSQQDEGITPTHLHRGPADGSTCGSSHPSLAGSHHHITTGSHHHNHPYCFTTSHLSLNNQSSSHQQMYSPRFNYSDPKHLHHHHHHHSSGPNRAPAPTEYQLDSDSMVSDVSYTSSSIPSHMIPHYHKLPRPTTTTSSTTSSTTYRSPTPFNHEYDLEESMV